MRPEPDTKRIRKVWWRLKYGQRPMEGYIAETHGLVDALTRKQERLHMAMATGVLCVKLDRDSMTQSLTMDDCPALCRV